MIHQLNIIKTTKKDYKKKRIMKDIKVPLKKIKKRQCGRERSKNETQRLDIKY